MENKYLRNQLVVYPKYAIQHIIVHSGENHEIPISPLVDIHDIHTTVPFELKFSENGKYIVIQSSSESDLHTHSKALQQVEHDQIEIFIKLPLIHWKPNFTLFKSSGQFICSGQITNESDFEYKTSDIKLVFRSIDHPYQKEKDDRDIPTIDSSNFVEYALKDRLPSFFVLKKFYSVCLWFENLELKESIQINIETKKPKYVDSFLEFQVPELMLPGYMEIIYRLQNNDILHLGTIYNKIHLKDSTIKIMFPMNKSIKVKNHLEVKHHSFFIEKTRANLRSSITKLYMHPLHIEFICNKNIQSSSITPREDNGWYVWDFKMEKDKDEFILEFSY